MVNLNSIKGNSAKSKWIWWLCKAGKGLGFIFLFASNHLFCWVSLWVALDQVGTSKTSE